MRSLRLAVTLLVALVSPMVWPPAWAAQSLITSPSTTTSTSPIAIAPTSANAGSPEVFTITRTGADLKRLLVVVKTSDDTARAGVDYTAISQVVILDRGVNSVQLSVPTMVNAKSMQLDFHLVAAASSVAVIAVGTIFEPTQTCSDGTILPTGLTCPVPVTNTWVPAPLQDGGFAKVLANDSLWDMTGPGNGRHLVPGEIVAVYYQGWGYSAEGQVSFAIYALSDGSNGRALAGDLQGVAPVGTPPGLPTDWFVPGLVTANQTCPDIHTGGPGIVLGGVYRAENAAGGHMKLASGMVGGSGTTWEVFAVDNQNAPSLTTAHVSVSGTCLTGV